MMLPRWLKDYLREGVLHRAARRRRSRAALARWEASGRPLPPPQAFKHHLIATTARRHGTRVLVETGTNHGDTVSAAIGEFDAIYSIELMPELFEAATRRFARRPAVHLRQGDSARELPPIVAGLAEPALFWLDAHYSGAGTARASVDTPIAEELRTIAGHHIRQHAILIDDARHFDGSGSYPTIEACRRLAAEFWPSHTFEVIDDVIHILPPLTAGQAIAGQRERS